MSELLPIGGDQEDEDIISGAENAYAWFIAYQDAGFTEEQAMALIARPMVVLNNNIESGPEMSQAMSKMSMIFDRQLAEEDE